MAEVDELEYRTRTTEGACIDVTGYSLAWNGTKVRRNWRFTAPSISESQMPGTVRSKLVFRTDLQGTTILQSLALPSSLTRTSLAFPQFKSPMIILPSSLKPSSKLYEDLADCVTVYGTLSGVRFLQFDGILSEEIGNGTNKTIMGLRVRPTFLR